MDMVSDSACAGAFATCITADGGEIGVELRADGGAEKRCPILGAEDQMKENFVERLRHRMGRAFSPRLGCGVGPGAMPQASMEPGRWPLW